MEWFINEAGPFSRLDVWTKFRDILSVHEERLAL